MASAGARWVTQAVVSTWPAPVKSRMRRKSRAVELHVASNVRLSAVKERIAERDVGVNQSDEDQSPAVGDVVEGIHHRARVAGCIEHDGRQVATRNSFDLTEQLVICANGMGDGEVGCSECQAQWVHIHHDDAAGDQFGRTG